VKHTNKWGGSTHTFNTERGNVLLFKLAGKMSLDKRRLEHTSATWQQRKRGGASIAKGGRIADGFGEFGYLSRTSVAYEDEFECGDLGRFSGHHGLSLGNRGLKMRVVAMAGCSGGVFVPLLLNGRFGLVSGARRGKIYAEYHP
jgi:hypothetical protein